jgi:enoyl-CoA hydratase/carnithine racemase
MTCPRPGSPRTPAAVSSAPSTHGAADVEDSPLATTVTDGIAHVRLNRPDRLNALTLDTLTALAVTARSLAADRTLRVMVLSGAGDSFSSGLDIPSTLRSPGRLAAAFLPRPFRGTNVLQEAAWAWRRLPVPVVAAVHGHCYGGGLQIALAADFRLTTPGARWSAMESRWGIVPDMTGTRTLTELVGLDIAKRLVMTAEVIDGSQAQRLGLATEVHHDPLAAALDLAGRLAGRSPDALAAAKVLLNRAAADSTGRSFARERREQLRLLMLPNTRRAQRTARSRVRAEYGPRSHWAPGAVLSRGKPRGWG